MTGGGISRHFGLTVSVTKVIKINSVQWYASSREKNSFIGYTEHVDMLKQKENFMFQLIFNNQIR